MHQAHPVHKANAHTLAMVVASVIAGIAIFFLRDELVLPSSFDYSLAGIGIVGAVIVYLLLDLAFHARWNRNRLNAIETDLDELDRLVAAERSALGSSDGANV